MKKVLLGAVSVASLSFAGTAAAQCGGIQVGAPNWSTGEFVAAVDAFILSNGMGCEITNVPAPTKQVLPLAMGATEPLLVGEFWANGVEPIQIEEMSADGIIEITGSPFPEAGEFWYVSPAFAAEYPELDTVEEVLGRPDLFDGKFYGCPVGVGWGCEHTNRNLFNSWGMADKGWTLENPGSGEGQSAIIIDAYESDSNWIGYYWTPTAVAINNELVSLDWDRDFVGADYWGACYSSAEAADDCEYNETSYSIADVVTLATGDLATTYPEVHAYAMARSVSMPALGAADAEISGGMSAAEAAVWYLTNYEDEWTAWVSEDVADAVRGAL